MACAEWSPSHFHKRRLVHVEMGRSGLLVKMERDIKHEVSHKADRPF